MSCSRRTQAPPGTSRSDAGVAGNGILVAVMVDYWLAGKLGRVWLNLHKGLRLALGALPGECALVARGH